MGLAASGGNRGTARFALAVLVASTACNGSIEAPNAAGGSAGTGGTTAGTGAAGASGSSGVSGAQSAPNAFGSMARRLTRTELDNSVRDTLGETTAPAATYLSEDEYDPFDNNYTLQRASRALIDSLEAFADAAAARALTPANRARVVPCTPTGPGDAACFTRTIETLGRRLFRRPLTPAEISPYLALQAFATEDNPYVDNDFYTAVELALRSMLQDPEFLYRIEIGTTTSEPGTLALGDYEIASRLAYLLWGSTPDDTLLDAAGSARIVDPGGRRAEAERLLADDRAKGTLHRFHAMWLGYRAIPVSAALVTAFDMETTQLIDRVVFGGSASYLSLFLSPDTYLNDTLADHYGLSRPSGGEGWVGYGNSGRGGILSHGSVLAGFGKFSDTSPTQRGIFVQTRLLCNPVTPPPANVNVDEPPSSGNSVCKTDRYAEHRSTASCAGCHAELDSIGLGLEGYDMAGRFRTHDDGHPECPVSGDGELPGHGPFNGPGELAERLVASGELEQCFVQHLLRYAIGRPLRAEEAGVVDALARSFRAEGYAAKELLLDYVSSDRFALRREEPPQ